MLVNYGINNLCRECKKTYPKPKLKCDNCNKRLRTHAKGYATRLEVPRISQYTKPIICNIK